jgi:4-alpha-glucanotransferase
MESSRFASGRHAGVLAPLFSIPSTASWGIGEIGDIPAFASWLRTAGQDFLQLLPVNEMANGQHSPYSATSAMAIDPVYISVYAMEDFQAIGGEPALSGEVRHALDVSRAATAIDYARVRFVKRAALRAAFARFLDDEWWARTPRAETLAAFIARERWWLDDYALYRALHARHEDRWWGEWADGLPRRDPEALARAKALNAREILFRQYVQWIAGDQWHAARSAACGVAFFGDLPFTVNGDSADVWARQDEFDLDASVGAPPDAFAERGQNWGLPVYRWDVMEQNDFAWLQARARRMADLYDGYRIDHLVGFYRTYVRPNDGEPYFTPAEEAQQQALGERLLGLFAAPGALVMAEDLGTVPDFVRASLARLGVSGYKVFRWEREWHDEGQPFRDPAAYPAASVATTGTHDTQPLAVWWDEAPEDERRKAGAVPALARRGVDWATAPFTRELGDAVLETLAASGSNLLLLPVQDVFGWRARVNLPGTTREDNWTWRMPWPVDQLAREPEACERAAAIAAMCRRGGRGSARKR